MRTQANLVETPFLKLTTDFLNCTRRHSIIDCGCGRAEKLVCDMTLPPLVIFGNTTESTKYWNRELKSLLMYKYAEVSP